MYCRCFIAVLSAFVVLNQCTYGAPRADGQLEIEVVDKATGKAVPARMHLQNTRKRSVRLNLSGTAEFGGHFYIDGTLTLPMRRGQYTFELDAGPEYRTQTGHFEIGRHADDAKQIEVTRFAELAKEGWYGADLDFTRGAHDLPLILRAEQLVDVRTPSFAVLLDDSLDQSSIASSQAKIKIARVPYAWDIPLWLASGDLGAIQLIHRHSLREGVVDHEEDGRPRDESLFPGRNGNGRWSETVYYHVLNCGFRIPPVAGSGSGTNNNPVGTNRVYVYCGEEFSPDIWWEELVAGKVFVTNGPLLRPIVQGQPPGYVFPIESEERLELEVGLNLATRVPVEYLEIIKNGSVYTDVRLSEWSEKKGRLPPIEFEDSGWFLVRAVTNNPKTYQFASSGPYYVEKGGRPRVSRRSVQFFLDWIDAAEARLRDQAELSPKAREALLAQQAKARVYFENLLIEANAE